MYRTQSTLSEHRIVYSGVVSGSKKYRSLLIFMAIFIMGITLGTLLLRVFGSDSLGLLVRMVETSLDNKKMRTLSQNFVLDSLSSMIFIGTLFVCGFCAVAQPVIVLLPMFRGLGIGVTVALIYSHYGLNAFGYVALLIMPGAVISCAALIFGARESLRLSQSFFGTMILKREKSYDYGIKTYIARYIACGVLVLASAFVQAVLNLAFAKFFVIV